MAKIRGLFLVFVLFGAGLAISGCNNKCLTCATSSTPPTQPPIPPPVTQPPPTQPPATQPPATQPPNPPPTPAPVPTPTPVPACVYAVQETPQNFTYQGGNGGFSVSTNRAGCTWSAVSNVPWIAVTGGSTGSGNGSVTYLVAGNGGPARTGTISVAGKTVTIVQSAP